MGPFLAAAVALFALIALGIWSWRQRSLDADTGVVSRAWLLEHRANAQSDHRFP
jgi:hypothetical protein